ncbi:glutamate synthase large subunit [bacterium]|nr:glutamate synthase large subunit [bacterium]
MNELERRKIAESNDGLYNTSLDKDSCGVALMVQMKGIASHDIVSKALTALENLEHRGACGCEENTGDGAGILIQMPHALNVAVAKENNIDLPEKGKYASGLIFLSGKLASERDKTREMLKRIVIENGQTLLGFRQIPIDDSMIGPTAREPMPHFEQVFIGVGDKGPNLPGTFEEAFERRLYIIRKTFEKTVKNSTLVDKASVYIPSLSSRIFIYKGMLISHQVRPFFKDLTNPLLQSAIALVHSRFSTNTFPRWELAQPFRFICHNGEINTLRGNINWMRAREAMFESKNFGNELEKILPIVSEGYSDSAIFDNALEVLVHSGYSLPHAIMMMIPEAWSGHKTMPQDKKDFYEYHASLMEPWDGPAYIGFTDGHMAGAVLDRNGLRPGRFYVTKDDLVILASEVGVLDDIAPETVVKKGRLQPGRMFLVDTVKGRIIEDEEIKNELVRKQPYGEWLKKHLVALDDLPASSHDPQPDHSTLLKKQNLFGYTDEDIKILLTPMIVNGEEGMGSMGTDTSLAVLSEKPQSLFFYFKQLFAQVTNPPLDAIREELVTSMDTTIGAEKNLLEPTPENCHQIKISNPILDNDEFAKLVALEKNPYQGFKSKTLPILFEVSKGAQGLRAAMDQLFSDAKKAIETGSNILILSDRGISDTLAPIPSLMATAGLHHFLVKEGLRVKTGLVLESGEPREVHHFALLLGYGAAAINPYVAFETFDDMIAGQIVTGLDHKKAVLNFKKAVKKGIVKVMSKMGISTIQSYRGAQIFEAVGLNREVIDAYFTNTATRIEGVGFDVLAKEIGMRHAKAFPKRYAGIYKLEEGGEYQWRRTGNYHLFNPDTVAKLQHATHQDNYGTYKEYAKLINDQSEHLCTLRGLMKFVNQSPIPIEQVEPIESILKRFKTGAMSFGSISAEAHEGLAIAMNRIGGKSNTGEGGEDPARFVPAANGDLKRSRIKQVASGRFGVTSHYLTEADEIQIKMAQGAKPGEGGQLPGKKVWPWIAKVRHSTPYVGLISPPPHHDIYSIEDLAQLIFDLKNSNPKAGISVKLVSEVGVGTVAAGVAKAHADLVLISGYDGGTGASPLTSIKHAGIPWELGLAETQQTLVTNKLRDRIRVEVDGQLKTGRDVAIGALLGAEEFGFSTAPLVTMGCILMRVCHLDTCPAGIATQNPELRKKFIGKPEYAVRFFKFVAQELREIMAELGFRTVDDMIGRVDKLDLNQAILHYKAKGLDYSKIFHRPALANKVPVRKVIEQDHGLDKVLDNDLIKKAAPALDSKKQVRAEFTINNRNRTTGTMLGHELTKRYGGEGLANDTIHFNFKGSAGQSFGAFVPKGITLELEGDANDYVGKGLSGGKVIVYPDKKAPFVPEANMVVGNVVLYGATGGEAYFRGVAGERFCVRNSGAVTVVEGVGDHGCEYMTGGRVVVLGKTGRNFGAGMSGGIAYVYDADKSFSINCNTEMVEMEPCDEPEDLETLKTLLTNHVQYTGSTVGKKILDNLKNEIGNFVRVMPKDYKAAIAGVRKKMKELNITEKEAMYG